jgi:hypothetical protein
LGVRVGCGAQALKRMINIPRISTVFFILYPVIIIIIVTRTNGIK